MCLSKLNKLQHLLLSSISALKVFQHFQISALTFIGCPMKTMGRLLEADGGQLQQPNRLQPLEKVKYLMASLLFQIIICIRCCHLITKGPEALQPHLYFKQQKYWQLKDKRFPIVSLCLSLLLGTKLCSQNNLNFQEVICDQLAAFIEHIWQSYIHEQREMSPLF